jgi:hypothetical protein
MLATSAKFRPAIAWFARQIAPSVLATLIAALVIAGYNRAFSGHLQQPRMAAMHAATDAKPAPPAAAVVTEAEAKPRPAWLAKVTEIADLTAEREQIWDKDEGREAIKDQGKIKIADVAPAAVAPATHPAAARPEFRSEPRAAEPRPPEPRVVVVDPRGAVPVGQPVVVQPIQPAIVPAQPAMVPAQPQVIAAPAAAMPVAQEPSLQPPPVITAKPMVTVPDRPGQRPPQEAQAEEAAPAQQQGVLGAIVNTLKPSSLFRSAREFGDKIEAAGNDMLPNIRQQ